MEQEKRLSFIERLGAVRDLGHQATKRMGRQLERSVHAAWYVGQNTGSILLTRFNDVAEQRRNLGSVETLGSRVERAVEEHDLLFDAFKRAKGLLIKIEDDEPMENAAMAFKEALNKIGKPVTPNQIWLKEDEASKLQNYFPEPTGEQRLVIDLTSGAQLDITDSNLARTKPATRSNFQN